MIYSTPLRCNVPSYRDYKKQCTSISVVFRSQTRTSFKKNNRELIVVKSTVHSPYESESPKVTGRINKTQHRNKICIGKSKNVWKGLKNITVKITKPYVVEAT